MLLRESGRRNDQEFDLNVVVGGGADLGIEHQSMILELTDLICRGDRKKLAAFSCRLRRSDGCAEKR